MTDMTDIELYYDQFNILKDRCRQIVDLLCKCDILFLSSVCVDRTLENIENSKTFFSLLDLSYKICDLAVNLVREESLNYIGPIIFQKTGNRKKLENILDSESKNEWLSLKELFCLFSESGLKNDLKYFLFQVFNNYVIAENIYESVKVKDFGTFEKVVANNNIDFVSLYGSILKRLIAHSKYMRHIGFYKCYDRQEVLENYQLPDHIMVEEDIERFIKNKSKKEKRDFIVREFIMEFGGESLESDDVEDSLILFDYSSSEIEDLYFVKSMMAPGSIYYQENYANRVSELLILLNKSKTGFQIRPSEIVQKYVSLRKSDLLEVIGRKINTYIPLQEKQASNETKSENHQVLSESTPKSNITTSLKEGQNEDENQWWSIPNDFFINFSKYINTTCQHGNTLKEEVWMEEYTDETRKRKKRLDPNASAKLTKVIEWLATKDYIGNTHKEKNKLVLAISGMCPDPNMVFEPISLDTYKAVQYIIVLAQSVCTNLNIASFKKCFVSESKWKWRSVQSNRCMDYRDIIKKIYNSRLE